MPALNQANVKQFQEEGFLVVEDVLDVERDIQPLVDEYTERLDELATQWHSEGLLSSDYRDLPFDQRITQVLNEMGELYIHYFEITLPFARIEADSPFHLGPAVFNLLRSPRILDTVESLLGPEIFCTPAHHVRLKIPVDRLTDEITDLVGTAAFHQDQSGTLPEADDSDVITSWFAISDATEENGCLQVWPRSHEYGLMEHVRVIKNGKHYGTIIPDELIPTNDLISLPVKAGSAIFLTSRTAHGSLANRSTGIRWSMDFRYHPVGRPTIRPMFPGFVARSRQAPETELRDYETWLSSWLRTKQELIGREMPVFHRWTGEAVKDIT